MFAGSLRHSSDTSKFHLMSQRMPKKCHIAKEEDALEDYRCAQVGFFFCFPTCCLLFSADVVSSVCVLQLFHFISINKWTVAKA